MSSTNAALTDLGKPVFVKAEAPSFTLFLKANPSTGYEWFYAPGESSHLFIESAHSVYVPSKTAAMGAAGIRSFTFQLKPSAFEVPSILKITLIEARPWEIKKSRKNFEVQVITVPKDLPS